MTVNEYKKRHGPALKVFLETEAGRDLLPVLHQLRPLFVVSSNPHVHTESAGAVRGFETCEKAIPFLCAPPVDNEEIEMTYGVNDKK